MHYSQILKKRLTNIALLYKIELADKNVTVYNSECANSVLRLPELYNTVETYHHTNIYNNVVRLTRPDLDENVLIAFFGHRSCVEGSNGSDPHPASRSIGLTYSPIGLVAINCFDINYDETEVLYHEVGHLFSAPDHYGGSKSTTQEAKLIYGINSFDDDCIYGENRLHDDIIEGLVICEGCQQLIRQNANRFNHDPSQ